MPENTDNSDLIPVSMKLTHHDMDNLAVVAEHLNTSSDAVAISQALNITQSLLKEIAKGQKLLLEDPDGSLQQITFSS